jgi:signal transduction histidine kinase/ligand-binding sensor domain-containing protein
MLHSCVVDWRTCLRRRLALRTRIRGPDYQSDWLRHLTKAVLAVVVLCRCAPAAISQASSSISGSADSPHYTVHQWPTSADGLPTGTIQCLLQTRDGYLWIGTRSGLLRFDGERFITVASVNCLCLSEDRDGALWIGAQPGLLRCRGGDLERFVLPGSPARNVYSQTVFAMCPAPDGGIWLDGGGDLFRAFGSQIIKLVSQFAPGDVHGLHYSRAGRLFMAGHFGLREWNPNEAHFVPSVIAASVGRISCIHEDPDGDIWFGSLGAAHRFQPSGRNQPLQLAAGRVTDYPSEIGSQAGWVWSIANDPHGTIWAGTSSGLWQVSKDRLTRPSGVDGGTFGGINCMLVDREGNLFLGTERKGLFCLERKRFNVYTTKEGLAHNDVWSVSVAPDGSLWIGTARGLSHFGQGRWENYGASHGLVSERVRSVLADSSGAVWVGTEETAEGNLPGALYCLRQGRLSPVGHGQGIDGHDFPCLYEDAQHHVWIGDGRIHEGVAGVFRTVFDAPLHLGRFIFIDHAGQLWLSEDALDGYLDGQRKHYDLQSLVGSGIYCVAHEDEHGALWFWSSEHGLVRFKNGKFRAITTVQGLFSDETLSLLEDAFGNYWMNSSTGIFFARKDDLNAVADGRQSSLSCVVYGPDDGLLSVEGNGGNSPDSCKTPDGRLWFPTTRGLAVVDPADTRLDALPPSVIIESLRADGKVLYENLPSGNPKLPPVRSRSFGAVPALSRGATRDPLTPALSLLASSEKARNGRVRRWLGSILSIRGVARMPAELRVPAGHGDSLELRFTSPMLLPSDRVRFKYRLLGRDNDWIELGTQRFVSLEDLPPGHYTFCVTASNRHGIWNETGASLGFYVAPLFHQTALFYVLCVLAAAGIVASFLAYRLHVQRHILHLEQVAALAQQRERIARDMHDDLGASLTQITLLSEVARRQLPAAHAAGTPITHIGNIARNVLDSMSELIWGTNPNYDTLANLIAYLREYAARSFANTTIECRLDFPTSIPDQDLPSEFRRELFLVFKEALTNIHKHSGATRADIRLTVERNGFEMIVADNGQGLPLKSSRPFNHGLGNMRRRAATLGGTFAIHSQPGHGTTIRMKVPLPA